MIERGGGPVDFSERVPAEEGGLLYFLERLGMVEGLCGGLGEVPGGGQGSVVGCHDALFL